MDKDLRQVIYNCPFCGVELRGVNVEKATPVRCPNLLSEDDVNTDNEEYNEYMRKYLESARKSLGVDKWPYSGKCGKSFIRMPLRKVDKKK